MEKEIRKITSRSNEYIKEISKLGDKKYRAMNGRFAFEGRKLLDEALKCNAPLEGVLFTEKAGRDPKNRVLLSACTENVELIEVSDEVYEKISFEKSPEGIFCVSKTLDKSHNLYIIYNSSNSDKQFIILDGIRDPGNLGTILRAASAFGIDTIILSDDCADLYNSKTVRAAMGAIFRTRTARVRDLPRTINELKHSGYTVYGAALDETSALLTNIETNQKTVFVIGNEASGIRREVLEAAGKTIYIPMETGTESLNAASAATIIMWEMYRNNR